MKGGGGLTPAQPLDQRRSGHVRQRVVQQQQIGVVVVEPFQGLAPVEGAGAVQALIAERLLDQIREARIVFHDQNRMSGIHAACLGGGVKRIHRHVLHFLFKDKALRRGVNTATPWRNFTTT